MPALARWCFRHRKLVLTLWLVAVIAFLAADVAARPTYSSQFQLPNTDSARALNILKTNFPAASGESDEIVLEARRGTFDSPGVASEVTAMLARVAKLPGITSVVSPFSAAGSAQVSKSRTIAFATVDWNKQAQDLSPSEVNRLIDTAEAARSSSLQVELAGQAIENVQPQLSLDSTALGVLFALIVLGILFGAILAAIIPVVTALIAMGIGFAFTGLMSHVLAVPSFVPILGVLIGLGVGIDYALFIITRHRNGLRAGRSIEESAVHAVSTAGRAVFFAGLTVCIALLGQFVLGLSVLYGLAITGAVTVLLTMFASLTLLPAFLGFFGMNVLGHRDRKRFAESGPSSENVEAGFWFRWSKGIERQPALQALGAVIIIAVVAIPVFSLQLGLTDAGSDPPGTTTRLAYDALAQGFGPGFNGPLQLVTALHTPGDLASFDDVVKAASTQRGVVFVTPPQVSPGGKAAIALVYPSTSPQATETSTLLHALRDHVVPAAEGGSDLHVLVGGRPQRMMILRQSSPRNWHCSSPSWWSSPSCSS
jgi:RND superfamily putative drug exporter